MSALATVCRHHGLAVDCAKLRRVTRQTAIAELGDVIVAARLLGFDGIPLEGTYDELPEVPRPNLVMLDGGELAVLLDLDANEVRLADRTLSRDEFCTRWTGDCVQMVPERIERGRAAIEAAAGIAPNVIGFALACLAITAVAVPAIAWGVTIALPLAIAAACGAWLVAFRAGCSPCARAHQLAGALRLDLAGALGYVVLIPGMLVAPELARDLLFAAAGAHVALVGLLVRDRSACVPCLIAASSAWVASAMVAAPIGLAIAALGAMLTAVGVPWFARTAHERQMADARRLAHQQLRPEVRVVVWKRPGCAACLLFEAMHAPALAQEFGDALVVEALDATGTRLATPTVLVTGAAPVLFAPLGGRDDDYDRLRAVVERALAPEAKHAELSIVT